MSASLPLPWTIRASTCRFFPLFGKLHFRSLGDGASSRLEMSFEDRPPLALCEVEVPEVGIPGVQIAFGGEIRLPERDAPFRIWVTVCPSERPGDPRLLCGRLDRGPGAVGGNDGTGVWVAEEDRPKGDDCRRSGAAPETAPETA